MTQILNPIEYFQDSDGSALENGYIYIGTTNLNPETNPLPIYWDINGTIPAPQPLRTSAGCVTRNGIVTNVFTNANDYSITIRDRNRNLVFTSPSMATTGGFVFFQQVGSTYLQTVQAKLNQYISVKDFGAVGDGVTNDQVALAAAVTYALSVGAMLYWPAGSYLSTSTIPNFHSVRHSGEGSVKRGGSLFYVSPWGAQLNVLYVATTGSAANDGLSSLEPMLTIQNAITALGNYGAVLDGEWNIVLAAGTYARGRFPDTGMMSRKEITIKGPAVGGHPNVPTAIISEGASVAAIGLQATNYTRLIVQDIKFVGFNASVSSSGLAITQYCEVFTINAHFSNCYYGITSFVHGLINVKGGIFTANGFLNGVTPGGYAIRGYFHTKFELGLQNAGVLTQGPFFTFNSGAVIGQEHANGHSDWCTYEDNAVGVRAAILSRFNLTGSSFKRNSAATWATDNSVLSTSTSTVYGTGADINSTGVLVSGGSSTNGSDLFATGENATYFGVEKCMVRVIPVPGTVINTTSATVIKAVTLLGGLWRDVATSSMVPKTFRWKIYATLTGVLDIKRFIVRFGATPTVVTFSAAETGVAVAEGTVMLKTVDSQFVYLDGYRNGGAATRSASATLTEALTADTTMQIEALVGNVGDSITINAYELFVTGL